MHSRYLSNDSMMYLNNRKMEIILIFKKNLPCPKCVLLISQTFAEIIICSKHFSRHWGYRGEWHAKQNLSYGILYVLGRVSETMCVDLKCWGISNVSFTVCAQCLVPEKQLYLEAPSHLLNDFPPSLILLLWLIIIITIITHCANQPNNKTTLDPFFIMLFLHDLSPSW